MSDLLRLGMRRNRGVAYYKKVLAIQPTNLIGYWRMNDATTTMVDSSPEANNGSYSAGLELANAAGPDGVLVPYFDGNDYANMYSTAFDTDFNGDEITIAVWAKVSAADVWSDAELRRIVGLAHNSGSYYIQIDKTATANRLTFSYRGTVALVQVNVATAAPTGWVHWAMTVSKSADAMIAYVNGVQSGTTQTGFGEWPDTGSLVSTQCNIGAYTQVPGLPFTGWISHVAIWKSVLTPAEVAVLANPT